MKLVTYNPWEEAERRLAAAELMIESIKDSIPEAKEKAWPQPQHSRESIKRRCIVARYELLMLAKALDR